MSEATLIGDGLTVVRLTKQKHDKIDGVPLDPIPDNDYNKWEEAVVKGLSPRNTDGTTYCGVIGAFKDQHVLVNMKHTFTKPIGDPEAPGFDDRYTCLTERLFPVTAS